jgi:hypothetical protein
MNLCKRNSSPRQTSLQVLFGALLGVKTNGIEARRLPAPQFPLHHAEVAFGLFNPLGYDPLHR